MLLLHKKRLPEVIRGNRIILRIPDISDSDFLMEGMYHPDVKKYINVRSGITRTEFREILKNFREQFMKGKKFTYCITLPHPTVKNYRSINIDNSEMIQSENMLRDIPVGLISLRPIFPSKAEIGIWVRKEAWGKHIASEALEVMVNRTFIEGVASKIIALIIPENKRSINLFLSKGFSFTGKIKYIMIRGRLYPLAEYILIRNKKKIKNSN